MCDTDFDGDEPLVSAFRTARQEHRCYACREPIRMGDRYHYTAQTYNGDFEQFKHCLRCYEMCNAILNAGAHSIRWDLHCGMSWEEAFGERPPERVEALAFLTPDEAQRLTPDDPW